MKSRRLLALAVVAATSAGAGCYGAVGEYYDGYDTYPYVTAYANPYYGSYYAAPYYYSRYPAYRTYPYYARPYYRGGYYHGGYYHGGYHARPHHDGYHHRGGHYSHPHDRGSYRGVPPSAPRVHHGDVRSAPGGVSVQRTPHR